MDKVALKTALRLCKQSFWAVGVFSGLANLLMLVPAFFMLNVYDKAVAHNSIATLWVLSGITLFLFGALAAMEILRSKVLIAVSSRLDRYLSPELHKLTYEHAVLRGADRASVQPLRDLNGLRNFLTGHGVLAFFDAPWVPIYLLVMFLFHPLLGWLGTIAAFIFLGLAYLNQVKVAPPLAEANKVVREIETDTQRNLRNAEVAYAMGMLGALQNRWRERQDRVLLHQEDASSASAVLGGITKTLRLAVQSAAIAAGAFLVLNQEISPGMLIAGSILVGRALAPIEIVVSAWRGFSEARDQYERLDTLLESAPQQVERLTLPPITGRIGSKNAGIAPPGEKEVVVRGVTFELPENSTCMILGPSGSGKSTLIRGLLGLWPVAAGELHIDGAKPYDMDRSEIGPQIGYLPQDIELLEGTISSNIARFGKVDDAAVVQAAKDAGIHEIILSFREGYETKIGGGGEQFSPGQKQRIALARTLYKRPKLIIMDEPNSNLDQEGEAALNEAIQLLKLNGCTTVMVSHRQNALALADYLMVIVGGVMRQFGPRDDVLENLKPKTPAT